MRKKAKLITTLLIISLSFSGCFNYRDINKMTFVTSTVFDEDEQGNVIIYLDCVKAYRSANESSEKGRRIVYKGLGKTVLEAMNSVNVASSNKINYTQCKAYIFTEKAAKSGMKKYLDIMDKEQEFLIRQYMFIFFGDTTSLIKNTTDDEEYLGLYLNDLVLKSKDRPRVVVSNINDYLVDRLEGNNISIVGALELKKDVLESRVKLQGGAIIENDKLVGKLDISEGLIYNLLKHKLKNGIIEARNPENPESYITFKILKSDVKTKIEMENDNIRLIKDVKINTSLAESQQRILINDSVIMDLKKQLEKNIEETSKQVFNEYKQKDLDVLNVKRLIYKEYPNMVSDNIIQRIDLEVNVSVKIEGSSQIKETL